MQETRIAAAKLRVFVGPINGSEFMWEPMKLMYNSKIETGLLMPVETIRFSCSIN